ncbi:MAG: hypothetical protein LBK22_08540 [Tannerella sp.]|jgi:hypothetical protein|nr:hypothetical protein [Tannerella sp.]
MNQRKLFPENAKGIFRTVCTVCLCALLTFPAISRSSAAEAPVLPAVFSDGMVLQRNSAVKVWGKAEAGQPVAVAFGGQNKSAVADAGGNFALFLDPMAANAVPQTLTVSCGDAVAMRSDILVGDVFLCSGQSNMQFQVMSLTQADRDAVMADSDYPDIRYYLVAKNMPPAGNDGIPDTPWRKVHADMVAGMSAVSFYFAREIYREKHVPLGMIDCSRGSASADAWIGLDYYDAHPGLIPLRYPMVSNEYQFFRNPGVLYTTMLSRVLPYTLAGFLWYQGESNAARPEQYRQIFPAVIDCFRKAWSDDSLPFLFVQLASYGQAPVLWPFVREVQDSIGRTVPRAAMVSAIDVGAVDDVHPKNKKVVGERLALAARNVLYGETGVEYTGPTFQSVDFTDGKAVVAFSHADGLRTAGAWKDEWEVCGENYVYLPATGAQVNSDGKLEVWRTGIDRPVAVRYAWKNFPAPSLYNASNLPANPFRSSPNMPAEMYVSSAGNDGNPGTNDAPFRTLAHAVSLAGDAIPARIFLPENDRLTEAGITIPSNKIIEIAGRNTEIRAAESKELSTGRIFYLSANSRVKLSGLILKNGRIISGDSGKARSGGAVYAEGESLEIENCSFVDNAALYNGGAVANYGKQMYISRSYFEGNAVESGSGGAVFQGGVESNMDNICQVHASTFYRNTNGGTAADHGGSALQLCTFGAGSFLAAEVVNCTFLENVSTNTHAQRQGALSIYGNQEGKVYVVNNTLYNNTPVAIRYNKPFDIDRYYDVYMVNNVLAGAYGLVSNRNTTGGGTYPRRAIEGYNNVVCGTEAIITNINDPCFSANLSACGNVLSPTLNNLYMAASLTHDGSPVPFLPLADSRSMLIDAGVNGKTLGGADKVPSTDARGYLRTGTKDIGAYEYGATSGIRLSSRPDVQVSVSPNPAGDYLLIRADENRFDRISISGISGTRILETAFREKLTVASLPRGIYLLRLTGKQQQEQLLFCKK